MASELILHTFSLVFTTIMFCGGSRVQETWSQTLRKFTLNKTKNLCQKKGLDKQSPDFFFPYDATYSCFPEQF